MGAKEETAGFGVRSDALKKGKSVANAVAGGGRELRRVEQWVNGDDLLEKRSHDT